MLQNQLGVEFPGTHIWVHSLLQLVWVSTNDQSTLRGNEPMCKNVIQSSIDTQADRDMVWITLNLLEFKIQI